jgi:hypothetical protein
MDSIRVMKLSAKDFGHNIFQDTHHRIFWKNYTKCDYILQIRNWNLKTCSQKRHKATATTRYQELKVNRCFRRSCYLIFRVEEWTEQESCLLPTSLWFLIFFIVRPWKIMFILLVNVGWLSTDYSSYIPEGTFDNHWLLYPRRDKS